MHWSCRSLPGNSCRQRPGGQPADAGKPAPVAAKAAATDAQQAPADLEDHGQAGAVRRGGQRGHLPGAAQAHRGAGDLAAAVNANPAWLTVALVAELASFTCNFALQRLALRTKD